MVTKKKRPLGKSPAIPEATQEEASAPDSKDIQRADDLANASPVLKALWEAKPYTPKEDEK